MATETTTEKGRRGVPVETIAGAPPVSPSLSTSPSVVRRIFSKFSFRSSDDIEDHTLTIRAALPKAWLYIFTFILFVVIPAFLSIIYLVFIASDQYIAETRFAVRSAQSDLPNISSLSALASLGLGIGQSQAGQDPYIVTSYIHSRAVIDDISKTIDIREIYRRSGSDFWSRLRSNASIEDLLSYWKDVVTTYIDGPSGIITVAVRSFAPEDSLKLLQAILAASENLVNDVSARARNDAMTRAESEVRRYEAQVRDALLELKRYRDTEGLIDPVSAASSSSKLLLSLLSDKIQLQNELFAASRAMSETAPSIKTLRSKIESIDGQISQIKAQIAGNSVEARTISSSLVKFEELELKRTFAEQLYTMAQSALERARVRAERQNLYISVFVPPALPEQYEYPNRLSMSFILPLALLIFWGIFALIAAAVEDHLL